MPTPSERAQQWCALSLTVLTVACAQTGEGDEVNPLHEYGLIASNAFFYYEDLDNAVEFYNRALGIRTVADYGFAKILHVAPTSYLTLVDGTKGMHTPDEPKTVAIALVTDQLDEWYTYLQGHGVEMQYDYDPVAGRPHHGFVLLDPEGYYLEFERFNEHEENRDLMPILDAGTTLLANAESTTVPEGLGFKATVLWLYYRDLGAIQRFYEEKLGLSLTVDQGWAKIYQTSPSGFLGPVDEARGMHSFTEQKAVTVSLLTEDLDGWFAYVSRTEALELRSKAIESEDARYRAFVGYDPEGYYWEFDTFLSHEANEQLLASLSR
jgi:catechol 2,3-dioxygenase-like lactoylglutathione lyase family enzyme